MRGPEINKPKLNRRRRRQRPLHRAACSRGTAQAARAGRAASRRPKPINQNFAAPDSSGTHAPTDQENQPEMPEREHAGAPNAVLARPLAVPSDPVATARPRPAPPPPPPPNTYTLSTIRPPQT